MRVVTQPTERPATYDESFRAVKAQMMESSKITRQYSEKEIDVMVKYSLMEKAKDKVEFSLHGQIKRGKPAKKGMSDEDFSREWRIAMKKRLEQDGFTFKLSKEEEEILEQIRVKKQKEATEEVTKTTAEALKKILNEV